MKAKDVMTHCVVSIAPGAPILEAIGRMISHQVSGMPVIDADGKLAGMITEGDFLHRAETHTEAPRRRWLELLLGPGSPAEEYSRSHGRSVQDVMSPNVITVDAEAPLGEVVRLMEENAIKRIPVVEDGRVVGIVSRADLMAALAERPYRIDEAIGERCGYSGVDHRGDEEADVVSASCAEGRGPKRGRGGQRDDLRRTAATRTSSPRRQRRGREGCPRAPDTIGAAQWERRVTTGMRTLLPKREGQAQEDCAEARASGRMTREARPV